MNAKQVKKLISKQMTNRKLGISLMLGECDDDMERIHIKFPTGSSISLNPIINILRKHRFEIHQIISWWFVGKQSILLIREQKSKHDESQHG